jgi:photosystem II stability/assembly factor-like uncharacterized protein
MRRTLEIGLSLLLLGLTPFPTQSQWSYLGLGNRYVTTLELHDEVLYAGTTQGLYSRRMDAADTLWTPLGLEDRSLRSLLVLDPQRLLAGTRVIADTVSLYRSVNGGATWLPYQNGFGGPGGGALEARSIEALPGSDTVLFAAGPGVEKSVDGGASWRPVVAPYLVNFVRSDPRLPERVWAGGESIIFAPVMFRSLDSGETWQAFYLEAGGDNACDAIAFHPTDPEVVYVGMEGRVMRTLDAGMTWEEVTTPNPRLYLYGMAIPDRMPLRIYAAGAASSPNPDVVLYESDDGGSSWRTLVHRAPVRYGVNALVLVSDSAMDMLLLGTDRGVYCYREPVSGVSGRSWTDVKKAFR